MVSLPIVPDQTDPEAVVGFYSNGWYAYDPASGYLGYSNHLSWFDPRDETPGRGFWARFPASGGASPCGTIPAQNEPRTIHLYAGWNMIGQPFTGSVTWDVAAITVVRTTGATAEPLVDCGDAVCDYAWGWDPVKSSYYLVADANSATGAVGELRPWQAYWLLAYKECDLILPPP